MELLFQLMGAYLGIGLAFGVNMVFSDKYSWKKHGRPVDKLSEKWLIVLVVALFWPKGVIDTLI